MSALSHALKHFRGGGPLPCGKNLWACEIAVESQYELLMLSDPPGCLFEDITSFIKASVREDLRTNAKRMGYDNLKRIFKDSAHNTLSPKVWCRKHRGCCTPQRAMLHVGGTPCIAWSQFGGRAGVCNNVSSLPFMVWIAQRLVYQEDAVLHENVARFDVALLNDLLGEYYVISSVVFDANRLGQLADRERRFTWLLHRRNIQGRQGVPRLPWCDDFVQKFHRRLHATWREILLATESEVQEELDWATTTRNVNPLVAFVDNFEDALAAWERRHLETYMTMFDLDSQNHNLDMYAVSLRQNPEQRLQHNAGRPTLHTIVKQNFPTMLLGEHRWLTPIETMATNAFVVRQSLSHFGESTSFMRSRSEFDFPARVRRKVFEQAGDSMSIPSVGLALLWFHAIGNPAAPSVSLPLPALPSTFLARACKLVRRKSQDDDPVPVSNKVRRVT